MLAGVCIHMLLGLCICWQVCVAIGRCVYAGRWLNVLTSVVLCVDTGRCVYMLTGVCMLAGVCIC